MIAIVGILIALVLPAIQAAREAGRKNQCANHVKQLGLAFVMHHDTYGHFPSCGWGWRWVGDPDRGAGRGQPGNWSYQILPFLEESSLHQEGSDGQPDVITSEQKTGALRMSQASRTWMYCPSRFTPGLYPVSPLFRDLYVNCEPLSSATQLIYAAKLG